MNAPLDPSVMGGDMPLHNAPGRPSEGPTAALEATGGLQDVGGRREAARATLTIVRARAGSRYRKGYRHDENKQELAKVSPHPPGKGNAHQVSMTMRALFDFLSAPPEDDFAWLMGGVADKPVVKFSPSGDTRRSAQDFPWPEGTALLTIDSDALDECGISTLDGLADAFEKIGLTSELTMTTSASSNLTWPGGSRGLKGAHTFTFIDRGTEISRVLEALHVRACLAGYGRILIASNGVMHVRSIIDMALKVSCQPIYEFGAVVKPPVKQDRVVKYFPPVEGSSAVLEADSIPPLTEEEIAQFAEWEREEKAKLQGEADGFRERWLDGRVAHLSEAERPAARQRLLAGLEKEHRDLPPWYEITLKNGSTMTADALLTAIRDNPGKWHGKTLPDPWEPDYRDGACCATIVCKDQRDGKPKILSMAHGVSVVYHLEPRKEARACSPDDFEVLGDAGPEAGGQATIRRPAGAFPESVTVDEAGGKTHRRPENLADEALQILNEIADATMVGYSPEGEEARSLVRRSLDLADAPSRIYAQAYLHQTWGIPIEKVRELVRELVKGKTPVVRASNEPRQGNSPLDRLLREAALAKTGSGVGVLRTSGKGDEGLDLMSVTAARSFYANWRDGEESGDVDEGGGSVFDRWLRHSRRKTYDGIEFAPGGGREGYYNLWRGFAVEPKEGDVSLYLEFVLEVICSGDEERCEWLLNWMADVVQNPSRKPGTAVVLRGGEGIGKNVFVEQFGKLFGPAFQKVSRMEQLVGKFNKHLAGCLLIFANEAVWGGDRSKEGALKDLITEGKQRIEPEGLDSFEINDFSRFIFASNESWAVPAGPDARRFFALDVNPQRRGDQAFFAALVEQMENGGHAALLYHLLRRDLSGFNPRQAPATEALLDLKMRRLEAHESWWHQMLKDGDNGVFDGFAPAANDESGGGSWGSAVPVEQLYAAYLEHTQTLRELRPLTKELLAKELRKMVPGVVRSRRRREGNREWFYEFPALDVCRRDWESYVGQPEKWE